MSVNLFTDDSDKTSCPSDVYDDAYEICPKVKVSQSGKKKKPKRNRSAFIIFSSEMRMKLRANDREKLNSNEMMVKLAELWKNLAESEKKRYHGQAEKEKSRYHDELNNFYQNFPAEVIQNKTRKNHIKKPCSAYALFLKELKQEIKNENPDLKMADILKVVAERWKKLEDDVRSIYQKKAQLEKEIAKAKMNEAMNSPYEEPVVTKKGASSKKKASSPKKTHKPSDDQTKIEESETKTEFLNSAQEPAIVKKQPIFTFPMPQPNMQAPHFNFGFFFPPQPQTMMTHQNSNYSEVSYAKNDYTVPDFPLMNNPFSKLPSLEPLMMSKYSSRDENRFGRDSSQIWNHPSDNYLAHMPNDMVDLMNFQPYRYDQRQEYVKEEDGLFGSDDEDLPSTSQLTPTSSLPSSRNAFNNALIGALDAPGEFDPLNLDQVDCFIL